MERTKTSLFLVILALKYNSIYSRLSNHASEIAQRQVSVRSTRASLILSSVFSSNAESRECEPLSLFFLLKSLL